MDEIENATISFRQRVLAFWHLFLEQEYEIRYLLNSLEDFGRTVGNCVSAPCFPATQTGGILSA